MKLKEITVDLAKPPDKRWNALQGLKNEMSSLMNFFSAEIISMVPPEYMSLLPIFVESQMDHEFVSEIKGISETTGIPYEQVIIGNLYYDALKVIIGCSAFSTESENGPIHARNLDWYSNDRELEKFSLITRFVNGSNEFITVGWPGFTGCLSGMSPGKFSISLNAVLSEDKVELAQPVVYLIRKVLETASDFDEAISMLSTTDIASDCILMVCGTNSSEMIVIERTPQRSALRFPESGKIMATNDYKIISGSGRVQEDAIRETSCSRYNRMNQLLQNRIESFLEAKRILSDSEVRMDITMQQICFHPKTGKYQLF